MNTLKGLGAFAFLAGIALAVDKVAEIKQVVLAVTITTIAMSVFAYVASRKRYHNDRRIAAGPHGVDIHPTDGISRAASTGSRRMVAPRRSRPALALLAAVVLFVAGGSIYAVWKFLPSKADANSVAGTVPLTVRYRTDTPSTALAGKPWLEVINTSTRPLVLRDVQLRYYFSADGGSAYGANCFQTALGCSSITKTIESPANPIPGANRYLSVGFTSNAGILAPGQTSQGIGLQLYRLDHKKLNQANDHSFDPTATHYAPSKLVTAYVRGVLSWGAELSSHDSADAGPPVSVTAPQRGVIFDNFHYTGPDDPALAANGWTARTEGGGPGIHSTWSADGISFPADAAAKGGQTLQLRAGTDGTKSGTRQAELRSTGEVFSTGTLAARMFFTDEPVEGPNGDHINEAFCTISSTPSSPKYSELDYEYQPNGGWGAPGPKLDVTSWRSAKEGDRATHALIRHLTGWHTVMLTAVDGVVTYSIDGRKVYSTGGKTFPREKMQLQFSAWLVDLPFAGKRTWEMRVNWIYSRTGRAMSVTDVQNAVDSLYASGINYADTTSHR